MFLIYSVACLLFGIFRPFAFNVIIYVMTWICLLIYLFISGLCFSGLYSLPSCGLLVYIFWSTFWFNYSILFDLTIVFYCFLMVALGVIYLTLLYIFNLSPSTRLVILPVWVKYKNLAFLFSSRCVIVLIFPLHLFRTMVVGVIIFASTWKFRKLKRTRKRTVFTAFPPPVRSSFRRCQCCCFLFGGPSSAPCRVGLQATGPLRVSSSENVLTPFFPEGCCHWLWNSGLTVLFFSALEKTCASSFWPPWFLMRNPLSFELFSSYR